MAQAQQASQARTMVGDQASQPGPSEAEKGLIAAIDQMTQDALGNAASAKTMREKILAFANEQSQHIAVMQQQLKGLSDQQTATAKYWEEYVKGLPAAPSPVAENK